MLLTRGRQTDSYYGGVRLQRKRCKIENHCFRHKNIFFENYQYVVKNIRLIDSQGNFFSTPAACPLIFRPFVTFDWDQTKWYFLQKLLAFMIITKVNKT